MLQGRAADWYQAIDGNAFGRRIESGQLRQQQKPLLFVLAHADDTAAANRDAGALNCPQRLQRVVISPRRDNGAVIAARRVQVVVVGGQASLFQATGLIVGEYAE